MEQILSAEETLFMGGNVAGLNRDHQLSLDWPAQESELQYCSLASRGQMNSHTSAATSVHPLVPLLLHSDRHLPLHPPYSQPISWPFARQADPPSWTRPCYHGNSVSRPSVKKPLNAFMLYMKETRQQVLQEGREKESAAINRILGRRGVSRPGLMFVSLGQWHALPRSEQTRFYDLAQKERLLHMQLHPGWSAKDNYGKRKRKQLAGSSSRSEVICSQV